MYVCLLNTHTHTRREGERASRFRCQIKRQMLRRALHLLLLFRQPYILHLLHCPAASHGKLLLWILKQNTLTGLDALDAKFLAPCVTGAFVWILSTQKKIRLLSVNWFPENRFIELLLWAGMSNYSKAGTPERDTQCYSAAPWFSTQWWIALIARKLMARYSLSSGPNSADSEQRRRLIYAEI